MRWTRTDAEILLAATFAVLLVAGGATLRWLWLAAH